jgi:hypothetical protein
MSISTTLKPAHQSVNARKAAFLIFATPYSIREEPPHIEEDWPDLVERAATIQAEAGGMSYADDATILQVARRTEMEYIQFIENK